MEKQKVKGIIEQLLAQDERARCDDNWLWYKVIEQVCHQNGKKMFVPFEIWQEFPKVSSIFRCRQIIQNVEHRYLPSDPEVRRKRRIAEEEWLAYIRGLKNAI
jgi:hypothetical protein